MITAKIATTFLWLHFRIHRYRVRGQQRGNIRKYSVEEFEGIFDHAWPKDFPSWID